MLPLSQNLSHKLARRFKELVDKFRGTAASSMVNQAKRQAGRASLKRAKQAYDAGVVLLDVREVEEWREGHVRGAVHIPRRLLEFQAPKDERLRDKDISVITYCAAGARSALAAERLEEMGWSDVSTLDVGYDKWEAAGFPIERGGYEDL